MRKKHAIANTASTAAPEAAPVHASATGNGVTDNHAPPPPAEIRLRAYQKWEDAGKPADRAVTFWLEAEQELLHNH
jgi:hypothetical protein